MLSLSMHAIGIMLASLLVVVLVVVATSIKSVDAFAPHSHSTTTTTPRIHTAFAGSNIIPLKLSSSSESSSSSTTSSTSSSLSTNAADDIDTDDVWYMAWMKQNGIELNSKLRIRQPKLEERGKGGVIATETINALEVLARIPRSLVLSAVDAPTRAMEAASKAKNFSWAVDLTASSLVALHPTNEELNNNNYNDNVRVVHAKKEWIETLWKSSGGGGWATDGADLGPPDVNFGSKDCTGSLLSTGSDNDHNIYAKFRMPCHPVILRASNGLAVLTKNCTQDDAMKTLTARGRMYRSMRDALEPLVLNPSERLKGSNREKRCWDVADTLSRVLSRATMLQLDDDDDAGNVVACIVPLHERLAHDSTENSKLVSSGNQILLVATKDIHEGEDVTRDYNSAPRLEQDESQGALHLLTQFGLPPSAWDK